MSEARRTLHRQRVALVRLPLTTSVTTVGRRLIWTGDLQPGPLNDTYTVRMTYKVGRTPRVTVLRPLLRVQDVEELPHVYAGDELCLHYPKQWSDRDMITETILPWVSEWLLHFEFYKIDGKWHGGGHEPAVAHQ